MKVRTIPESNFEESRTTDLEDLFKNKLDGDDYGRGQLEAAAATASNNSAALGRLVEILIKRNLLSLDDVVDVLRLYRTTLEEVPESEADE